MPNISGRLFGAIAHTVRSIERPGHAFHGSPPREVLMLALDLARNAMDATEEEKRLIDAAKEDLLRHLKDESELW